MLNKIISYSLRNRLVVVMAAMLLFELFSFFNPIDMLIAYVGSSALTLMLVLVLGRLQGKKNRDTVHGG